MNKLAPIPSAPQLVDTVGIQWYYGEHPMNAEAVLSVWQNYLLAHLANGER